MIVENGPVKLGLGPFVTTTVPIQDVVQPEGIGRVVVPAVGPVVVKVVKAMGKEDTLVGSRSVEGDTVIVFGPGQVMTVDLPPDEAGGTVTTYGRGPVVVTVTHLWQGGASVVISGPGQVMTVLLPPDEPGVKTLPCNLIGILLIAAPGASGIIGIPFFIPFRN